MAKGSISGVAGRAAQPIERNGPAGYAAEFVGTAILVTAIGFVLSNGAVAAPDFAALALLHVFVLMMLIATLGGPREPTSTLRSP
jgi:glycerol uptake facilitator-like aquaporin